jgi:hypothetical protein
MAAGKVEACSIRTQPGLNLRDIVLGPFREPQRANQGPGGQGREGDEKVLRPRGAVVTRSVAVRAEDQEPLGGIESRIDVICRTAAECQRLDGPVPGLAVGLGEEESKSAGVDIGPHEREIVVARDGRCPHRRARIDGVRKPRQSACGGARQLDAPQRAANLLPPVIMSYQAHLLARAGAIRCEYHVTAARGCSGFEVIPTSGERCENGRRPRFAAAPGSQDRPSAILPPAEEEHSAAVHK